MRKLINYFFNTGKDKTKLAVFMNWMWILLPLTLMTIMMIYVANTQGMTLEEKQHSTFGMIIGLVFIIWFCFLIWFIIYKIKSKFDKFKKKSSTKEKKSSFHIGKEDWEE